MAKAKSSILESMRAGNETTASQTAGTETVAGVAGSTPVETALDWSNLPAPTVAVYTRQAPSKDWEASTPEYVKTSVQTAFEKTANAGKPVWLTINGLSATHIEAFVKAARGYAKFRQFTFRGGINPKDVTEIRYCVKPLEVRKSK